MNGFQSTANQIVATVDPQWKSGRLGDFNGDGKADFVLRHTDGTLAIYLINGFQVIASQVIGAIGNEWTVVGVGDFNGDGKADFMTRRSTDGALCDLPDEWLPEHRRADHRHGRSASGRWSASATSTATARPIS